ncbi:MAG: recombinase family protein [Christensenellaceae bacterium]|jgi:DNA invertase Pin-like site-specific DNA recombinase|nr:recombinase family protein [Christensenellaceae bacterium]
MENAVIYARYSSVGQNEQTIAGQIRVCTEYAHKMGLQVVKVYDGDKAKSASKETEKRKDLHRMFADASTRTFQYIIVYKMDRFARNRNESRIFKSELERHGVRVLSATENITDDEGGELYEMILEWNDEKYSERLSKRVRDGLNTSVANGTFCGGYLIYGYKIDLDPIGNGNKYIKRVSINPEQAEIVKYAFEQYDKGVPKIEIAKVLNEKGCRLNGKPFSQKSFDRWLLNEKYTDEFTFGGRPCNNMYPQIIDKALFKRVQERLNKNKYFAGGTATARVPYLLTGKLFCGHCGSPMTADGSNKANGTQYRWYKCKKARQHKCNKKLEPRDNIENYVVSCVRDFLSDPKNAEKAVKDTLAYYESRMGEDSIKSVETKIAKTRIEVEELADSFVKAKSALLRETIEKKMTEYETLLDDLLTQKSKLELERGYKLTAKDLQDFIAELLQGDLNDKEYQKFLIDNLVDKVVVSDDDTIVALNLTGNKTVATTQTVGILQIKDTITKERMVQTQLPSPRHLSLV